MNEIVDIIDTKELGRRLKLVRQSLGMTQTEVAQEIKSSQLFISKVERGGKVLSPIVVNLLAYYSQSICIDRLFDKEFDIENEAIFDKNYNMQSMVVEKLKMLKNEILQNIDKNKALLNEQMDDAINLL